MSRFETVFDNDWMFFKNHFEDYGNPRLLNLPHDWSIEGDYSKDNPTGKQGGFLPAGIGWYRKRFLIPEEWCTKRVFVEFDGIYMNSTVWLNGKLLGHRPYGYIGFEYDITPHMKVGENLIEVKVDNSKAPSGRWYTGCGIYRHTWLRVKEQVHIAHWGIKINTGEVNSRNNKANLTAEINLMDFTDRIHTDNSNITVSCTVLDEDGNISGEAFSEAQYYNKNIGNSSCRYLKAEVALSINSPELWSPDNPYVYTLVTKVIVNGVVTDEETTAFGIRTFRFDSDEGLILNGKNLKIKGVCLHHDAGPVGAAVPEGLLFKRLKMMKEMGCNAIRTSHNPMAPEFYDMCDRLGFIVIDEFFDGWQTPKAQYDYGHYFNQWWEQDLKDIVMRDINHPCILIWSIGNEVRGMDTETTKKLIDAVHALDSERPVTCGIDGVGSNSEANRKLLDVAGYNEGGGACFIYEEDRLKNPHRKFIATEAPHTFQTRGFYRTQTWWRDKNKPRIEIENLTEEEIFTDGTPHFSSSYDNCGVRISAKDSWNLALRLPYLAGEFRWTGFDYLGESFGWPARMWNFGVVDIANFPKEHYYLYQSMWIGWTEKPMIHILPHWTHPGKEGVIIPVCVYSNCEEAELFLNGESLGKKIVSIEKHLYWNVPYKAGKLTAAGYVGGAKIVQKCVETAGDDYNICLTCEDLVYEYKKAVNEWVYHQVSIALKDGKGVLIPDGDNKIYIKLYGAAQLVGMENGNPVDLTPHRLCIRRAFYGLAMGIIRTHGAYDVLAGGILGKRVFSQTTKVTISAEHLNSNDRKLKIFYTTDGSEPCIRSKTYKGPFVIDKTCTVRAAIYENGIRIMELSEDFRQGEPEKFIDTSHRNR